MKIKFKELEDELNNHKDRFNKKLVRIKTVLTIIRKLNKRKSFLKKKLT